MRQQSRKTTKLKELFASPKIFVLAGGTNPLQAQLAQIAGFEAFYMSGGNTSAHLIGWPDVGVTTMREMVDNARRIAMAVDIPVFSDADTGYGNAVQVYRTIQEFIQAGVAGVHIEDQESPKKSGSMAGRRCISIEEMVGKLRAAMDAKIEMDPDFVVCARCDFRGAEGGSFEGTIERCLAYKQEANVDVLFPEGLQSWDEIKEACQRLPGPVLPLIHPVVQPHPSLEDQESAGCTGAFYPGLTTMAGLQASWDFLNDFKERGTVALQEFRERAERSKWGAIDNNRITKLPRVREMEEKYLPRELWRDYENTLGLRPE
jgi:2-methylisocitrate lyase-like PEP mutase family enzyme